MALANSNAAQAISNWQTASDPATAHSNLAAVWIEKGNYAEARKELVIALGYNRTHPAALGTWIWCRASTASRRRFRRRAARPLGPLEVRIQAAVRRAAGRFEAITGEQQMKAAMVRFLRDEQGQDLVEYALIVAAVGLALITTVNQLSAGIVSLYQSITGDLSSIGTPAA